MSSVRSASLNPVRSCAYRVDHAAILTAAVKLRARHPHLASHLEDGIGAHLLADPGRLLAHELVVERKVLVGWRTPQRDCGKARLLADRKLGAEHVAD